MTAGTGGIGGIGGTELDLDLDMALTAAASE
jgi:hypothetical protein